MRLTDSINSSINRYQNKYIVLKLNPEAELYKVKGLVAVVGRLVKVTLEPDPENEYEDIVRALTIRDIDEKNIEVSLEEIEKIIQF